MPEYQTGEIIVVSGTDWKILRLLGKGKGGYSYLAQSGDKKAVLKQIHHVPCAYYQFGDKMEAEMRDYKRLRELGIRIPELLDADREKERLIKEYIEGETVYELVMRDAVPEICLRQVKEMCRVLYEAGLNIDYFPTNFILRGDTLFYVDYECNDYMDEWNFENWGIAYWSKTSQFLEYADNSSAMQK